MDRLRAMEVFVAVTEAGSFTAAARTLGIPRTSATEAVQALEAHLGVKLLHRTTRRVAPTAEGAAYIEDARRLLDDLATLESNVCTAATSLRGRVRLEVPAATGRHLLAPNLPAFLDENPGLVLEIGSTDRPIDLIGEGVDCAIRGGDLHDDTLVARRLGELPVITLAAPRYLAAHGTPHHPDELDRHHVVSFFSARTGRHFSLDFASGSARTEHRPAYRVATNDSDTWTALAVAGLGLIQLPASARTRELVTRGELVRVLSEWTCEPLPLYVVYPRERRLNARVRVVVEWLAGLYDTECARARRFL